MKISKEQLVRESASTGFRLEILEKVGYLLHLLETFQSHPFLKGRLVLKGGTALNLFLLDLPRLSVDIDLNCVGAEDREQMLAERPKIESAISAVCSREGFAIRRIPEEHAGGKWQLRYNSAFGQGGNLELDINFMFRVPLFPTILMDSRKVGVYQAMQIPVLDIHELAAGKLAALLSRKAGRDLFDAHQLLLRNDIDMTKLRTSFVTYGAMSRKDWRTVSVDDVGFEANELANMLIPVLSSNVLERLGSIENWAVQYVEETRNALGAVLPFEHRELEFLDRLLDHGEIVPNLLTEDMELQKRIQAQPMLEWKAQNVRQFKGKIGI